MQYYPAFEKASEVKAIFFILCRNLIYSDHHSRLLHMYSSAMDEPTQQRQTGRSFLCSLPLHIPSYFSSSHSIFHWYMLHGLYHGFVGDIDGWDIILHTLCHLHMMVAFKSNKVKFLWVVLNAVQWRSSMHFFVGSSNEYDVATRSSLVFNLLFYSNIYIGAHYCWVLPLEKNVKVCCSHCNNTNHSGESGKVGFHCAMAYTFILGMFACVLHQHGTVAVYRRTELLLIEPFALLIGRVLLLLKYPGKCAC